MTGLDKAAPAGTGLWSAVASPRDTPFCQSAPILLLALWFTDNDVLDMPGRYGRQLGGLPERLKGRPRLGAGGAVHAAR
jgi:hypothetical protein